MYTYMYMYLLVFMYCIYMYTLHATCINFSYLTRNSAGQTLVALMKISIPEIYFEF